jgi:hypothetical protein
MLGTADPVMELGYGAFLIWGGVTAIRVLGGLVIAPRPAAFVWLRRSAIWTAGAAAIASGLTLAAHGMWQGV